MGERPVHVWLWSHDTAFAKLIASTLGPEFEARFGDGLGFQSDAELKKWWDVALLDLRGLEELDEAARLSLVKEISALEAPPPLVVLIDADEHELTLKAMEFGVYDTVVDPPDVVDLRLVLRRAHRLSQLERELDELRRRERPTAQLHELIGASESMQRVFALAQKIAPCDVSVLITGETGTGKELLARAIHRLSPRASSPFIAFSCASLPETLLEDELFGHERGAFTGALMARRGRFEVANRGTLFLDEIGDLGLGLQAKLLRVLQEHSFERLGSNTTITTDIRLICATHQDVAVMVQQNKFREDLYYRLNVVQLQLPPLRERREDIPFLSHHFLRRFAQRFGKKTCRFSRAALQALEEYHWPGNVRELENVVQRAVVIAEGPRIDLSHLPPRMQRGFQRIITATSYEAEVRDFKRRLIVRTLREYGGCKQDAARSLGLARSYLHRLINQLEIQPGAPDVPAELVDPSVATGPVM